MRLSNNDFGKKWSDLTMILLRIGGHQFQQDMNYYLSRPLEDTDSGRMIKREIEQLRNELKHRLPENIKERGRKFVEKATESKRSFVKTKAYKHSLKCLKEKNVITITGTIGSGKKTLASQLALHLSSQNYVIIPISDCKEIMQCCNTENQVFIINNPFGTSNLDTDILAKWSKYHDDICYHLENSLRSKIIFTCRLQIFKNETCKSSFDALYRNAINISEGKYELTDIDRALLLQMHGVTLDSTGNFNDKHVVLSPSLPLLCKISNEKDRADFANAPLKIYLQEIRQLFVRNTDYSFILHLVLAKKNQLQILNEKNYIHEFIINKIVNTLKIPVPPMCNLETIYSLLNELEGSFIKETGGVYSFINDTVYDVLAYSAGLTSKSFTIETCSREFFRNNLTFNPYSSNDSMLTLHLDENHFEKWFERLKYEVRNGRFLDIIFYSEFSERNLTDLLQKKVKGLPLNALMDLLKRREDEFQFIDNIPAELSCILREFPLKNGLNFLCGVLIAGRSELFLALWKQLKKSKQYGEFDKEDIMKAAVIGGNVDCLQKTIKTIWKRTPFLPPFVVSMRENVYKKLLRDSLPMSVSCACGHFDLVVFLHKLNFDVNERNGHGNGTLAYAAKFGNEKIVRYLISNNVDINIQNNEGNSPLMLAVESDAVVKDLLKNGANIYLGNHEEENVLMMACGLGKTEVVTKILEICNQQSRPGNKKDFINKQKVNGVTALHLACEINDSLTRLEIANMLLRENANPQTCDTIQRSSPLHIATAQNDDSLVNYLIYTTYDIVNCVDKDGVTPLFIAAENCFPRVLSTLLSLGADLKIGRQTDGASPLLISAERGHLEVVKILLQKIKSVDEHINTANFQCSTPLLLATLNNHTKVCEALLESGADVNIPNENGYNPILVASRNGNTKLIHLYLQNGADINSQTTCDKNSPLHLAAMMGNKTAIKYLLIRGADIECKNEQGLTPAVIATYMKQDEISDVLFEFRMYGSNLFEFQAASIESPQTETSLRSSEMSFLVDDPSFNADESSGTSADDGIRTRFTVPKRRSIANSSVGSVIYSDKGSIKSTSSFTSLNIN